MIHTVFYLLDPLITTRSAATTLQEHTAHTQHSLCCQACQGRKYRRQDRGHRLMVGAGEGQTYESWGGSHL